jgi:threonine/homoserine/homoserine lactone efflux protein
VVLPTLRRPAEAEQVERPAGEPSASSAFAQGLLTNVTNPKAVLFFAAILPQFIAPGVARIWPQILTLGLVDVVLGFVPWALVIVLGVRLSTVLKRAPVRRWWDRCTGTILGGLGLALILTDE